MNNSVFSTFLETGRVNFLLVPEAGIQEGTGFVLAHLELDFHAELLWPGTVSIGTRVIRCGRTSVQFAQALFQRDRCSASADTVVVLVDKSSRKPAPISDMTKDYLNHWK